MGVFTRADSRWFWLYLEPRHGEPGTKERTALRCDAATPTQRKENRELAEQLYHARMTARARDEIQPQKKPARTFAEQAAWFTKHRLPRRKGKEREAPLIPKLVAVFGAVPITKMTRTLVTELWETPRLTTPTTVAKGPRTAARTIQAGPRTVNREVGVIKAIVQSGVPDYLETSPLYGMPLLKTTTPKRRLMTPDEEQRLLAVMESDDKALFLIALDSLVRLSDVLDVRRRDDHGAALWIADPKAGGGFAVPLSSRARAALDRWYKARTFGPAEYLFPRRRLAETERDRRNGIRQMLQRYCAEAIPPVPYGRRIGGITFHWATRRTGVTRMLNRGVNMPTAQKIGRWKTMDVVSTIYHDLIDEVAHAAVNAVGPAQPSGNLAGIGNRKRHRMPWTRHRTSRAHR